ncbi:hypothetical protein [Muribaculum gordoncarteri]|uniref:hypothetical protein n=1 Tax=Muribaculum gordoncarteri TaxID=2530390 RepID=UPI003F677ABA
MTYLSARRNHQRSVTDADALITRTRTRCDARLLDGNRVPRFIATATIAPTTSNLDYCKANGITVANAAGM